MTMVRTIAITLAVALLMCGCAAQPQNASAPGAADLEVLVVAKPRAGARVNTRGYGATSHLGAFAAVDYESLDEIVVWVEARPAGPSRPGPSPAVDVSRAVPGLQVRLADLTFTNGGEQTESVYLRDEEGAVQVVGVVLPGQVKAFGKVAPGYVEVVTERRPDPAARLYLTTSRLAKVARSGEKLSFRWLARGECTIHTWHPRLPGSMTTVTLEAGKTTRATAVVGVDQLNTINPEP